VAGPIVNLLSYHWLFWIPMIVTIGAAGAAHLLVPESPQRSPGRISWLPALLLSAWLVALLLALSEAPKWGWGSGKAIALFGAAVLLAGAWIASELHAASPLIDMHMMRRRAVWTNNLVAFLMGVGMYAVFAFLPEFVQTPAATGYGFTATITQSGLILLPSAVTMFLVGLITGRWARRFGGKALVICGCLIGTVSMAMLAFTHDAVWQLYVAESVMGIGFGLVFAAMSGLIVHAVPPAQTGVASGMNANIRTIGGSVGAAVMASIVTAHVGAGGLPDEAGYTIGFAMLGGALIVAAFAAWCIPGLHGQPGRSGADVEDELEHPALAVVAAGTVVGDKPE
jgi:predicted MFS family arabinose efflux permease